MFFAFGNSEESQAMFRASLGIAIFVPVFAYICMMAYRIFGRKKEEPVKIILPKGARCCRCGKKIKKGSEFMYIDGKLYCEKCGMAKRDWDFLEMMALFED